MLWPGVASVTFRKLPAAEVVKLAVRAGLRGIEWGGDVHVPHGDVAAAQRVGRMTREAGLEVAAYGSYYRAGESAEFGEVLETAVALGALTVRVWAGRRGSGEADGAYRAGVVEDLRRAAEMGRGAGVRVAMEFHGGTLTDTAESTHRLLAEVGHGNLETYWQPGEGVPVAECAAGIRLLREGIGNVHVFHWTRVEGAREMHPLVEGRAEWGAYLRELGGEKGRWALLEFVRNDDAGQFLADAGVLRGLLGCVA